MATVNGTNYAKAADPTPGTNILAAKYWGGKVRVQYDNYTCSSTADGTEINVAKLPKGAVFLFAIISHAALGTGVTLQMGDSGDDDRYLAATSAESAGQIIATAQNGVGYEMSSDTTIFVKIGGAAATGLIEVLTFYAVE